MGSNRLTLHEAMVEVLRDHGGGWMDRDEIAQEIAERELYRQRGGRNAPSDQIRLRARRPEYQHLFECSDSRCTRIRLRDVPEPRPAGRRPEQARKPSTWTIDAGASLADSTVWYEQLREQNRPQRLRYLLIAESPPDPGGGNRRFFYAPTLMIDNLYRGVAEAVYGRQEGVDLRDKPAILKRLREDGYWLIDAVDRPINKLPLPARARAIEDSVPRLVERCIELSPERGVIICHGRVFAAAAKPLRGQGVMLLHDKALPFPLGNWRARFVEEFRRALLG